MQAPHLTARLYQDLVVLAERHQKHDGSDLLETVDPLPPFRALAANVHHPANTTARPSLEAQTFATILHFDFLIKIKKNSSDTIEPELLLLSVTATP